MTILGLELHGVIIGCMAYFLCLSQSPEVTTFHSPIFSVTGKRRLILVRPVLIRDLPRFIAKNICFFETVGRLASAYRAKYVTCKNAGIRRFFHMGAVYIVLNYNIMIATTSSI